MTHPSHKTHISDATRFDEICELCGATDMDGMAELNAECPRANDVTTRSFRGSNSLKGKQMEVSE